MKDALLIIKQHKKAFININIAFYGILILTMLTILYAPELQNYFKPDIDQAFAKPGILKTAGDVYAHGNILFAIVITFFVNLVITLTMTTLPSFIIPFIGILAVLYRAFLWGFLFAPIGPYKITMLPHALTLLLEGQAYILAAFTSWVHGSMFFWPKRYGMTSRWEGYNAGLVSTTRFYPLILVTLLISAIYEGIEIIYFMPPLLKYSLNY